MLYHETICHISVLNKLKVMRGLDAFTHIWVANPKFFHMAYYSNNLLDHFHEYLLWTKSGQ
jgi:hypothetical protein